MALNDVTLSSSMRQSLTGLQQVSALMARTTERLATGRKVNSAVDDPSAYFGAQDHRSRAGDLSSRKSYMGEALQTVNAADAGITGITTLMEQAKGLAASARSADTTERQALAAQFDDIMTQIDQLAGDSSYRGTNLLDAGSLTVAFNEDGTSNITVTGFDASSSGLGIAAAANDWAADADIDVALTNLDTALSTLRSESKSLASNLNVITTRQDFTSNMINTLQSGADNLTLADTNEETANMLALQVRQQLGVTTMGLSAQAERSILNIL
jgi:flagellin-like hook-associated protein FlgL